MEGNRRLWSNRWQLEGKRRRLESDAFQQKKHKHLSTKKSPGVGKRGGGGTRWGGGGVWDPSNARHILGGPGLMCGMSVSSHSTSSRMPSPLSWLRGHLAPIRQKPAIQGLQGSPRVSSLFLLITGFPKVPINRTLVRRASISNCDNMAVNAFKHTMSRKWCYPLHVQSWGCMWLWSFLDCAMWFVWFALYLMPSFAVQAAFERAMGAWYGMRDMGCVVWGAPYGVCGKGRGRRWQRTPQDYSGVPWLERPGLSSGASL